LLHRSSMLVEVVVGRRVEGQEEEEEKS